MCEAREQRGLAIAARSRIKKDGNIWSVPSQSGKQAYIVSPSERSMFCSCPDFEARGQACKHIYAVRIVIQREENADGSETVTETVTTVTQTKRTTYPQKWKEYNAAQVHEKDHFQALLRSLCDLIKEPESKPGRGRPRTPMSDCIFMAAFKVYSTVSQRRFMCDLDDAKDRGYLEKTPHYNAIGASLEDESMTPLLMKLIEAASLPLKEVETDFAADSTGFMSTRFVRWFDKKYGKAREGHTWVKLHAMCGVKTNVITAVEILDRNAADSPVLPALLAMTSSNFTINEVSADMAYSSAENFDAIVGVGADPFIPFKSSATGGVGGLYAKAFHFFALYRQDFADSYHKRSNIESSFSMIKRKFGDSVRSKTEVAMKNEVLCKVLAHNICCLISAFYELGIEPNLSVR